MAARTRILMTVTFGVALLATAAWGAPCPRVCRTSLQAAHDACRGGCLPGQAGKQCRSSCRAERRAETMLSWMDRLRGSNGAYWTGETHPDGIRWPEGEQTTWTTATVPGAVAGLPVESGASA